MGKRGIYLQGTEGQEEQRIIKIMYGNSVPFALTSPYCYGHTGET